MKIDEDIGGAQRGCAPWPGCPRITPATPAAAAGRGWTEFADHEGHSSICLRVCPFLVLLRRLASSVVVALASNNETGVRRACMRRPSVR